MATLRAWFLWTALWTAQCASYAIPDNNTRGSSNTSPADALSPLVRREESSTVSLGFVQRWATIGDSFTAGIGSGQRQGRFFSSDWQCSRYSHIWPYLVNMYIGSASKDFQFPPCSGARSQGVYQQAKDLAGNLDVVMLTAGGNDL